MFRLQFSLQLRELPLREQRWKLLRAKQRENFPETVLYSTGKR
jgi:hypothetical protein